MIHEFDTVLAAAQEGAEWAWRSIYDDVGGTLVGYFRAQGGVDPDALAGETLLRMSKSLGSFSGEYEAFRSWTFTLAHNLLIDDRRRKGRRVTEVAQTEGTEPVGGDVEHEAMDTVGTDWVLAALSVLTDDQREVVGLRILGGFTIGQIAEITGKRPGTVKAAQRRGLRRIADWHAQHPYPDLNDGRSQA